MTKQEIIKKANSMQGANREFSQEFGPIVEAILEHAGAEVEDSLESSDPTKALSAKQGKILNESKQDAPEAAGTSGQILSLNAQGKPTWINPAAGSVMDDEMSDESENPVQNKVIKDYVDNNSGVAGKVGFIETSLGKYSGINEITLSQAVAGKYVNVSGVETSAAGYGISNAVELNFGDILLVPSAEAVPASVSVVARVVTRAYAKVITYAYTYQQENPTLYDTATADYDPTLVYTAVYDTSGETPVLTGWTIGGETIETLPATHEVTESYYEPLVKQVVSAMPSTGYYVYLCPSAMTVVISGYTATIDGGVCKVVGWGIFKNIVSNFIGAPGQSVLAQLLCDLDARVKGIMARLENLGEVKAITIDSENLPMVCGQPLVVEGAGAPSVVPQFVGQRYHDTTNSKCYEAFAVTGATSNWKLLN